MAFDPSRFTQLAPPTGGSMIGGAGSGFDPSRFTKITFPSPKPAVAPPPPQQSGFFSALGKTTAAVASPFVDVGIGAAKGFIRPLERIGGTVQAGVDQTLGRGINAIRGKGFVPTNTAKQAFDTANSPELQSHGLAQNIGDIGATIVSFFLPGGVEKGLVQKGVEGTEFLAPKVASLLQSAKVSSKVAGKAASFISGLSKTGLRAGVVGASTAGVSAAQGGDAQSAGSAGALAGAVSGALSGTIGGRIASFLQRHDFKVSKVTQQKAAQKIVRAANFMAKNKIVPGLSGKKITQLEAITRSMEDAIQSAVSRPLRVSVETIKQKIQEGLQVAQKKSQANFDEITRDAKSAIRNLDSAARNVEGNVGSVSANFALDAKRSFGERAFRSSKTNDARVVAEGQFIVEKAYQDALSETLDASGEGIKIPENLRSIFDGKSEVSLPEFNRQYSDAVSATTLTNMNQGGVGLVGRLLPLWIGKVVGESIVPGLGGEVAGAVIGETTAPTIAPIARGIGEQVIARPGLVPGAVKIGLGAGVIGNPSPSQ